jgi:WhiB family redox-sensing transcriptional regulator
MQPDSPPIHPGRSSRKSKLKGQRLRLPEGRSVDAPRQADEAGGGLLRALVDSQPSWRREALCRSQPLAIFFPIRGQSDKPGLAVCAPCPVRPECLAEAIAESLEHGIRGGMTGQARVAARKAQATDDTEQAA